MLTDITSKQELVTYLKEAAVLEQQFMCQYLYAAFSLKKAPDATCNAAQFERVRRWASTLYLIARQEMEHLSVVNSILTAVGGTPVFYHAEFPSQSAWLQGDARAAHQAEHRRHKSDRLAAAGDATGAAELLQRVLPKPCDLPFLMSRFDLSTVRRFCCMESPSLDVLPAADRDRIMTWCFEGPDGKCHCVGPQPHAGVGLDASGTPAIPVVPRFALVEHARQHALAHAGQARPAREAAYRARPDVVKRPPEIPPEDIAPAPPIQLGAIQELYTRIEAGLRYLDRTLSPGTLFNGHPSGQSAIPSEYQIYLYKICDLSSALTGIHMIMEQGEGLQAPPGASAHFQLFYDIAVDYQQVLDADPHFEPSIAVPLDPLVRQYDNATTRRAVELWRDGYVLLLYMLAGYYTNYTDQGFASYPYLSAAMQQTAFAPVMTMLIRSLGEVIARLPGTPRAPHAGVDFNLLQTEVDKLGDPTCADFTDIDFFRGRLDAIATGVLALAETPGLPAALVTELTYIHQNMHRVWGNLAQIYQSGIFPNFNNVPTT